MKNLKTISAAVLLACASGAMAGSYSGIVIFGDSLTDSGAFTGLVPAGTAKFTNNPGNVWGENLAAKYGLTIAPGFKLNLANGSFAATGGTNYAIGGARITDKPGYFSLPAPNDALGKAIAANIVPITDQIGTYLTQSGGAASPGSLYAIWGGANDVFTQAGLVAASGASAIPSATNGVIAAGSAEVAQIARLRSAGVTRLLVVALPDMGLTPYGMANPSTTGALLTQLSSGYNTVLTKGLASIGATDVIYMDPRALFADVMARPSGWGITNTTIPACGAISSLGCGTAQQIPGSVSFLFADGVHPSAAAHKIIADWMYASMEAPNTVSAMTQLPMSSLDSQWRSTDARLQNYASPGFRAFASTDYAPTKRDGDANQPQSSGHTMSLTVGVEKRWQEATAGLALGYADAGYNVANGAGRVDYKQTSLSAFGRVNLDDAYIDGTFSVASLDFDTKRNLGPLNNPGSASGSQWGLKLGTGYNMKAGKVSHGPIAALLWQKTSVDGFSESGPTAMEFGSQSRESFRHRLGWQASWNMPLAGAAINPYVRLTHEKEYKERQGTLSAGMLGSGFNFFTPIANDTRGYGLLAVGANVQVVKIGAYLGATTSIGQTGGRQHSVSAGVDIPF